MEYILLTEDQAKTFKGIIKDEIVFNYAITLDGRYVCSKNSLIIFPELLENLPIVNLNNEDFSTPQDLYS